MDIISHLKTFLKEHNEAAIPGLGVFYTSEGANKKQILFKEKTPRSKAFINHIAFEENMNADTVLSMLSEWTGVILSALRDSGKAEISGIGTFEFRDNVVNFIPAENQFEEDDLYGLEAAPKEIDLQQPTVNATKTTPVYKEKEHKHKQEKPEKKKSKPENYTTWVALSSVAAVLVILFLVYSMSPTVKCSVDKGMVKIAHFFKPKQGSAPIVILPPASEVEVEMDVAVTEQPSEKAVYHVIAGAFKSQTNATRFEKTMQKKGYTTVQIYNPARDFHMVSIKETTCKDEALTFKAKIRKTSNIPCWIYKK